MLSLGFLCKNRNIENMTQKSEIGKIGEDIACGYLKKKGFKVLERNFRRPWGEIDIIGRTKDKTLVFVEVKTLKGFYPDGLQPEDQMISAKRRKFERAAAAYAGAHEKLVDDKRGWRLDLVAVVLIGENSYHIRHYENVLG